MVAIGGVTLTGVTLGLFAILALAVAIVLLETFTGSSGTPDRRLYDGAVRIATGIGTLFVVLFALLVAGGTPVLAGFFGGLQAAVAWAVLIGLFAFVAYYASDLSFGFTVTAAALLLVLSEVLPSWMTRPFAVISQSLFGVQFARRIDPAAFAVLAVATLLTYWVLDIRLRGLGKGPSTIANRVRKRTERVAAEYISLGRVLALFVFGVGLTLAGELGTLSAEFASLLAEAPLVASNLFAGILGYFGFGGAVPGWLAWIPGIEALASFLAGIGPAAYLLVVVVVLAVAFGASERLDEFEDRLERAQSRAREAREERDQARSRRRRVIDALRGDD